MPFKIKKTVSTTASSGNSVLFNGSNQYLSIPGNAAFNFGTGNFTTEWWQYMTSQPSNPRVFSIGNYPSATIGVSIEGGTFYVWENSGIRFSYSLTAEGYLNRWLHFAISRNNGTTSIFKNGIQIGSSYSDTNNINNTSTALSIGQESSATAASYFPGYISNFRVVNGTALYTSNFTPSTSPLTAIANTSLLTCQSATIIDNSTNNFTITNNNTATVSSTVVPFTTSLSLFKLKKNNANPTAPSGNSVLFNGSNQYLSVGSVANWAFLNNGLTPFTIEAWVNPTSVATAVQPNIVATTGYQAQIGFYFVIGNYNNGDFTFAICDGRSKLNQWSTSNNFLTANTWTHVAVSFTPNGTNVPSATVKFFVNGVLATSSNVLTNTTTYSTSNPTNTLLVGALQTPLSNYFPGYISNLRILNGTALYTSSFTVPTSPLTAIANTALLACQSTTIIDNSSNNFAITNNNTATVSSTITPFTASISTNKFKLKQVSYVRTLPGTQKAIFGYGSTGTMTSITNLVSNTGVVANDTTGVGTARYALAAAGYGSDKAIFGYGTDLVTSFSMTNKVSNIGVVSADTTGVGTIRNYLAAAGYGSDKAIFGYGTTAANGGSHGRASMTNLVSNAGVVSTDTTGVGTTRCYLAAAGYGTDKAIFGYGYGTTPTYVSMTNLVSNTGVVANDTTGVGTVRSYLAAAGYGSDKALFGYGYTPTYVSMTNLVSNTGVVATDATGIGTARHILAAAGYGSDKAIFGYGYTSVVLSMTNLVSNTGVVSTDTTGVGTARYSLAAAGYSAT
jgi:hypothetical protein